MNSDAIWLSILCLAVIIWIHLQDQKVLDLIQTDNKVHWSHLEYTIGDHSYEYCQAPYPNQETYKPVKGKLRQIHIFTRHGDRSPVRALPSEGNVTWDSCHSPTEILNFKMLQPANSPNYRRIVDIPTNKARSKGFWNGNCNPGQLTWEGHQQLYKLGQTLYDIYFEKAEWKGGIRPQSLDDFYLRSTDVWRTIQSAQSLVFGLLSKSQIPLTNLIPLHVQPRPIDALSVHLYNCPALEKKLIQHQSTPVYKSFVKESEKLAQHISKLTGMSSAPFEIFFDTFNTRRCHGIPLPSHPNDIDSESPRIVIDDDMRKNVFDMGEWWLYHQYGYGEINQGRAGKILFDVLEKIKSNTHKLHVYSAHDTTIAVMLGFLQVNDRRWPPFASQVILEIWDNEEKGISFIRALHNGQVIPLPFCNHKTVCGLEKFKDYSKKVIRIADSC